MHQPHPTWIEIDLSAISYNSAQIVRDTGTPLMAIVKGEAYGHGAAHFGEARAPRQSGIRSPAGWTVDYGASYTTPQEEFIGVIPPRNESVTKLI